MNTKVQNHQLTSRQRSHKPNTEVEHISIREDHKRQNGERLQDSIVLIQSEI